MPEYNACHLAQLAILLIVLGLLGGLYVRRRLRRVTNRRPWHWLRSRLGWGLDVEELALRLRMDPDELRAVEVEYREAVIPKRRGGKRTLDIPTGPLKAVQRRLLRRVLAKLRAHPAACGYERGKSIVDNAAPHVGRAVVLKMDLIDFFPTTGADRVEHYFRRVGWNAAAAALLARLTTHDGGLPQGAPTSPRLSNLVNFAFDARLARRVARLKGAYTRYADDLTISFPKDHPRRVRGLIEYVVRLADAHGYVVHTHGKLRILRPHQQQRVTGLVVNAKAQLPRRVRRRLRAAAHHLKEGRPATLTPAQLQGWRALQAMIEKKTSR